MTDGAADHQAEPWAFTYRYGEQERHLVELFAKEPEASYAQFARSMRFEFMHLIEDGLLIERQPGGVVVSVDGVRMGPRHYELTPAGGEFVKRWPEGQRI